MRSSRKINGLILTLMFFILYNEQAIREYVTSLVPEGESGLVLVGLILGAIFAYSREYTKEYYDSNHKPVAEIKKEDLVEELPQSDEDSNA